MGTRKTLSDYSKAEEILKMLLEKGYAFWDKDGYLIGKTMDKDCPEVILGCRLEMPSLFSYLSDHPSPDFW